jgi:flagellin
VPLHKKTNLEAANGRIMDVDIASESTALAKYNILVQASASMLSQANTTSNVALMLLN